MNIIKFSHQFPKLLDHTNRPINQAKLLQVLTVDLADLSAEFIDFDTYYNQYPLPKKGKYLLLIFMKPGNIHLFTTLRRCTTEKERYYRGGIGEVFYIQITPQLATP